MKDENKTKAQLEAELAELGQKIAALETTQAARKQLEREIEERHLYLESVLACAPDAIVTLDAQHNIQEWNLGAEKLFGYTLAEVVGLNIDTLIAKPNAGVLEEAAGFTQRVLSGRSLPPTETVRYRKNGSPVNVIVSGSPILLENEVVGVVAVYTDVTERVQAEEALKRKVEQLTALGQASQAITSSLQVDQVLTAILSLAGKVTAADYATVFLVDEAGHVGQSAENLPGVPSIEYRVREGGLTAWIVRSGQAAIIDEIGPDGAMTPDLGAGAPRLANPHVVEIGVESMAGLPLIARGNLRGVLYLHSLRPAVFHDQLPLLTAFANQAAVAIENARLYEALQQELAERQQAEEEIRQKSQDLALVNMMNEAANRGESLQGMIQLLSRETRKIFSSSGATVYLVSEDKKRLVMQNLALPPAMVGRIEKLIGTKMPAISIPLKSGSLYLEMLQAGQAQLINDSAKVERLMAEFAETVHLHPKLRRPLHKLIPRIHRVLGIQSIINVPLVSGSDAIGLLDISCAEPFTEVDLKRLETIAGQLTAIIERKQAEGALRASEEYTRNIIASSLDTIIAVDMERRIIEFNRAAQETFGYRPEEILGRHIDILYADPQEGLQVHQTTIEEGRCVREVSARRKNGAVFPSLISASALRDAHGELVGVMGVSRDITARKQAEEVLLRRNRELGLLNRAGRVLTSTLDLGRVISMVLEEVRRLMNVIACSAWLVDKKTSELVCLESTGPQNEMVRGWRLAPGEGIAGWAVTHGESLIVADAWTDERYFDGVDRQTGLGLRSILTVPLQTKEQVIGVLQVLDTGANRFSQADLELLEPLVASAAIAIENARLYEETSHRLAQTTVLREMMLAAASTLNFDQVLERTIEILASRLNIEYLGFMLPAEEGKFMHSHPALLGYTPPDGVFRSPTDRCITGQVYRTGQPVILPDVRDVAGYAVANENVLSELAVPVRVGDEVLAVLNLESSKLDAFGEEELEFYTAVAGQLGVAMDNARLYEQARRDAEIKSTLLREVNHRVQNNLTAIIGLLSAETGHAGVKEQPVYQSIMQNLVNRVQGLATVHSMLSASEWTPLLLHELADQVIHSSLQMLPLDKHISVDVTPSPLRVTSDQAHNLALLINELATNTVKHGMPGRDTARITVNITLEGDTVVFEFRDDGPGYPDSVLQQTSSDVGFDLIRNIVSRNLHGALALYNDHGAVAVIRFELLVVDD